MSRCMTKLLPLLFLVLLFTAGCSGEKAPSGVASLKVLSGNSQSAAPDESFKNSIRIAAFAPPVKTWYGKVKSDIPAPGIKLEITPDGNCDLEPEVRTAETDISGTAAFSVRSGKSFGDKYLTVSANGPDGEKIKTRVRFTTGLQISGDEQQLAAGNSTVEPVKVKLSAPDGSPAANVPVFFSIGRTPASAKGVKIEPQQTVTDENGVAGANVKVGDKTGEYSFNVEVADSVRDYFVRAKEFRILGFDLAGVLISVFGGLTLFVFGMQLMSDGLQTVAGDSMKKVIRFFARNSFVAVGAGAAVTAVIQSSSATTVMVIGFINAGLLNLQQAIGIIFGANIGTTITAQIISFNLSGIALPAITLGFLISLASRPVIKGWGITLLGFGLLFFGMNMMSSELKVLGSFPGFVNFFKTFDCAPVTPGAYMPIGAVAGALLIGMTVTMIIQSSSAATGIILAMGASGLINFYTAFPLILGTNIGTTVSAALASLGANRTAKQAALAHTLFNCIGSLVMVALLYVPYGENNTPVFLYMVNAMTPGDALGPVPQNLERHIAMVHTMFNVVTVVLLFPFIPKLAALCNYLLPVRTRKEEKVTILEEHLLATPSVALEQSIEAIRRMLKLAWSMTDDVMNKVFFEGKIDRKIVAELTESEEKVDRMRSEISDYLVKITQRKLTPDQAAVIPLLMHCGNDAERIADHTENIIALTRRVEKSEKFSESGLLDMHKLWEILDKQAHSVLKALGSNGAKPVASALKSEEKINKLAEKLENHHLDRLSKGTCHMSNSVTYVEMLNELEKLGDHLSNIAERAPQIQKHYIKF